MIMAERNNQGNNTPFMMEQGFSFGQNNQQPVDPYGFLSLMNRGNGGNMDAPGEDAFRFYNHSGVGTPPPSGGDNPWTSPEGFGAGAKAAANIGQMFLGFKNSRLAKDQLNFQKDAFLKQFSMQVEDRERSAARAKASATGISQYANKGE
jgi:hypothetical protein